jgi:hypothetical protein
MTLWLPVDLDAGLRWCWGELTDGQLILAEVRRPAVFVQGMTGRASWRSLAAADSLWRDHAVAFLRTDCPGLRRLLAEAESEIGSTEPSGQDRWHVPPWAFHAIDERLARTYSPERRRFLRRRQRPVVREEHGLAVASL